LSWPKTNGSSVGGGLEPLVAFVRAKTHEQFGHLDRIFDIAMRQDTNVNGLLVGRLLMFVSMFALGVLATFVWRSYVQLG
jgi:hypothetical protein